jgi:hypothetical protein
MSNMQLATIAKTILTDRFAGSASRLGRIHHRHDRRLPATGNETGCARRLRRRKSTVDA